MSASPPTIAVLIPNWNDARYLRRCISSVLDQDVLPDEVVIVDDASTDDSVEVIHAAAAGNARVNLVMNKANMGVFGAMEVGLRHIRSDYVLFLAANDFVLPGLFLNAKSGLAKSPGAAVWSALAWLVDDNDRPVRLHPSAVVALREASFSPASCVDLARRLGNWFTGVTLIYRREALLAAGGFDRDLGASSDLFMALGLASRHGAVFAPLPLGAIRVHEGSYSSTVLNDPERVERALAHLRETGPRQAPELFTPDFLERTALRLRFASVRASAGRTLPQVVARTGGLRGALLRIVVHSPGAFLKTGLAFLLLRPFDVWPTLRYRLLGWLIVRARATFPQLT